MYDGSLCISLHPTMFSFCYDLITCNIVNDIENVLEICLTVFKFWLDHNN
jgi:hypothetical protein